MASDRGIARPPRGFARREALLLAQLGIAILVWAALLGHELSRERRPGAFAAPVPQDYGLRGRRTLRPHPSGEALMRAAADGDVRVLRKLLGAGADPNYAPPYTRTRLMVASAFPG